MAEPRAALARWLESRLPAWRELEARLKAGRDSRAEAPDEVMQLVMQHRSLARDVSLARSVGGQTRVNRYLEALYLNSLEVLQRPPRRWRRQSLDVLRSDVPRAFWSLLGTFMAVTALFFAMAAAGWLLVSSYPETAGLFLSEKMIDEVQSGRLWTQDLLNVLPSSLLALGIMTNNIIVSLFAFALGTFYGLGTLYIIGLNGLMLGGAFGFTRLHGLDGKLFEFVIAHGMVELSVIFLAGAAGVKIGEALIRPGGTGRAEAFQLAVERYGRLLLLCVVFLIGAGLIEGFISPDPEFSLATRIAVGTGYWLLLAVTLTGAIWRRRGSYPPVRP